VRHPLSNLLLVLNEDARTICSIIFGEFTRRLGFLKFLLAALGARIARKTWLLRIGERFVIGLLIISIVIITLILEASHICGRRLL